MNEIPIVKKISRISNMFTFIKKSNIIVIPKVVSRIQIFFGFNLLIHVQNENMNQCSGAFFFY